MMPDYVSIRMLREDDALRLESYFMGLSEVTRSRFAPHPFDGDTARAICTDCHNHLLKRVVAIDNRTNDMVAYALVRFGTNDFDRERLAAAGFTFNEHTTATYAPSVADRYHGQGLGTALFRWITAELIKKGIKNVILWGGVQAGNHPAMAYYQKLGFTSAGTFEYNGLNHDMLLQLAAT